MVSEIMSEWALSKQYKTAGMKPDWEDSLLEGHFALYSSVAFWGAQFTSLLQPLEN